MKTSPDDQRSALAIAMAWASRVTAIAMEMALPGLLGWWVDRRLSTGFVFVVVGGVIGFASGMMHLLKLAKSPPK